MTAAEDLPLRRRLRRARAYGSDLPGFDIDDAPSEPRALFERWLTHALDAEVLAPQAMTVSTHGPDGVTARVVMLSDVTDDGWHFATDARSRKAHDLVADPAVALSFFWPDLARQVLVTGRARPVGPGEAAADFLSRSPASRGAAIATDPGAPLASHDELREAIARGTARAVAEPALVLPQWQVWVVAAEAVEFWQGNDERAHVRLVYAREADGWTRTRVWP